MLRTAVLSLLAGAVIAANWLRLEQPADAAARATLLVLLAGLPSLLRPIWLRGIGFVAAAACAVAVAFHVSPRAVVVHPGIVASRFSRGVADFYAFRLPIDPAIHSRMHMVLLAALFAFAAATAILVAARRAVFALVVFVVGAGWPATLLGGGHEFARGAFILVTALVLLAGLTQPLRALALPSVLLVVVAALALSTSAAVAKPAFLNWQSWNPYAHHGRGVSVSFVWNSSYTGISFPKHATTVLTIAAPPTIGTYWRATTLDRFSAGRWEEDLWRETASDRRALSAGAVASGHAVEQRVTVNGLRDPHLVAASIPIAYRIDAPAMNRGQNVVTVRTGLHPGEQYTAWSYTPDPTPFQLLRVRPVYPDVLTRPGRELELARGIDALPFGTPGGDQVLMRELVGRLAPYRALLLRARQVVGTTRSPYAAAVALEQFFRASGGFTYSEQPPQPVNVPALVGFVTQTRSGYCQQYAGAMALMARMLGLPARVAAGFANGRYANAAWTITDHDAHTWVEVWFRGYGWLPFDPTPGRGHLAASYSAASIHFDASAEAKLLAPVLQGGAAFGAGAARAQHLANVNARSTHSRGGAVGNVRVLSGSHSHSLLLFLISLAAACFAVIGLAKLVRRKIRYVTRDPRRLATACIRELVDFVVDQRLTVTHGQTAREITDELRELLVVDTAPFTDAVEAARFGPASRAPDAATRARRELRELKRRARRELLVRNRVRGFLSLRSLGFS